MTLKLAFLGLGIMGAPMAGHLKNKGYDLKVWNRNPVKVTDAGFQVFPLEDVVIDRDFIMMCLGDDLSVENMVLQILPFLKRGAIIIDHTTISASISRKIYKICKEVGVHFLDAPITGGQIGARNGSLVMMCGGDEEIFEASKDILKSYTSNLEYFGKSGSGQLCKMVNQICIASVLAGLSEAANFGRKAGIDTGKLFKMISEGAGGSWQMKNRHELMLSGKYEENFGFPTEWMLKDLKICLEEAQNLDADLTVTEIIKEKYKRLVDEINPRFDTSSLILLLK